MDWCGNVAVFIVRLALPNTRFRGEVVFATSTRVEAVRRDPSVTPIFLSPSIAQLVSSPCPSLYVRA